MWIYLVRHAQTTGNINRIVQLPDTPLSEQGYKQAQCLAEHYQRANIQYIVSSDYQRTLETAKAVSTLSKCDIKANLALRERNFGDLRGQAYDDIKDDFFAKDYRPVNGETYPQFVVRVRNAWQDITSSAQQQNGNLMIMTHGLVVRCILEEIFKLSKDLLEQTDIKNTSVTKVSIYDYNNPVLLCDTQHLSNAQDIHDRMGKV